MLRTYRGILTGDRIEWHGQAPAASERTSVIVTFLEEDQPSERVPDSKAMVEALGRIAAMGGIPGIEDPVEWQREIRRDRPLPGRDE